MLYNKAKIQELVQSDSELKLWYSVRHIDDKVVQSEPTRFLLFKKSYKLFKERSTDDNFVPFYRRYLKNQTLSHQPDVDSPYCGLTQISRQAGVRYQNQKWWPEKDYQPQTFQESLFWQFS